MLAALAFGEAMPAWILPGVAFVETKSYQDQAGAWRYIDQRPGRDGELGMCQMLGETFKMIRRKMPRGTVFADLRRPVIAAEAARLYMEWLYERTHSWDYAVMCYNVGLHGRLVNAERAELYLAHVKEAGGGL
jgi:hypothetical protein